MPLAIGNHKSREKEMRELKKKVLVLDDEKIIGEIASFMLNQIGCEVEVVRDGEAAVSAYMRTKAAGRPFDLVILDINIRGGMGGEEAFRKLLGMDPDVRAIVSSGQLQHPIMTDYKKYGFRGSLQKPYSIHELREELKRAISGR